MISKIDLVDEIYFLMEEAEILQNDLMGTAQNLTNMIQELETRAVVLAWQLNAAIDEHHVLYSKGDVDLIQKAALNEPGQKVLTRLCRFEGDRIDGVKTMARAMGQNVVADGDFTIHIDRLQLLDQNRLVLRHLRDLATRNRSILVKSLRLILSEYGKQKALVQQFGVLEAKVYARTVTCGAAGVFGLSQEFLMQRGKSETVIAPTQTSSRW